MHYMSPQLGACSDSMELINGGMVVTDMFSYNESEDIVRLNAKKIVRNPNLA